MASFLLDTPQAGSTGRDFSGTFPTYRAWYFFPYASDRWQVNKKLTVDIGLRWELYPPGLPAFPGQFSNYIPSNNTLVVGGVGGNPNNGGLANHLNYLAPRFGVAYRLTEKTVIRTGIGVSYTPFEDNTYINNNYPTKGNIGAVQGASAYTSAALQRVPSEFRERPPGARAGAHPLQRDLQRRGLGLQRFYGRLFPDKLQEPSYHCLELLDPAVVAVSLHDGRCVRGKSRRGHGLVAKHQCQSGDRTRLRRRHRLPAILARTRATYRSISCRCPPCTTACK